MKASQYAFMALVKLEKEATTGGREEDGNLNETVIKNSKLIIVHRSIASSSYSLFSALREPSAEEEAKGNEAKSRG